MASREAYAGIVKGFSHAGLFLFFMGNREYFYKKSRLFVQALFL